MIPRLILTDTFQKTNKIVLESLSYLIMSKDFLSQNIPKNNNDLLIKLKLEIILII